MIQGYQMDQSLPLRLLRSVFDNVVLEDLVRGLLHASKLG